MTDHVYPSDVADSIDPASLTYDIKLPWVFDNASRCRSCHAPVAWARHEHTLKKAPFNPDGTSHFATCPQSAEWRKRK